MEIGNPSLSHIDPDRTHPSQNSSSHKREKGESPSSLLGSSMLVTSFRLELFLAERSPYAVAKVPLDMLHRHSTDTLGSDLVVEYILTEHDQCFLCNSYFTSVLDFISRRCIEFSRRICFLGYFPNGPSETIRTQRATQAHRAR